MKWAPSASAHVRVKQLIKADRSKVLILNPAFLKYIYDNWTQHRGRYPCTGFTALLFALHTCQQVESPFLSGFSSPLFLVSHDEYKYGTFTFPSPFFRRLQDKEFLLLLLEILRLWCPFLPSTEQALPPTSLPAIEGHAISCLGGIGPASPPVGFSDIITSITTPAKSTSTILSSASLRRDAPAQDIVLYIQLLLSCYIHCINAQI
ncbi:hypothetical protein Nmel_014804 [Mimus melanotis]